MPAHQDHIIIRRGVDFWWARQIGHLDGTIKNLEGWSGRFNVYPGADPNAAPVVTLTTDNGGLSLELQGVELASTTLASAGSEGDDTVTVTSASGMSVGDTITVVQNEVAIREAIITGIAGTAITMSAPLTDDTDAGAVVQAWDSRYMVTNVLLYMGDHATKNLVPWGRGLFDLDLFDSYGHSERWFEGTCVLQEGTR